MNQGVILCGRSFIGPSPRYCIQLNRTYRHSQFRESDLQGKSFQNPMWGVKQSCTVAKSDSNDPRRESDLIIKSTKDRPYILCRAIYFDWPSDEIAEILMQYMSVPTRYRLSYEEFHDIAQKIDEALSYFKIQCIVIDSKKEVMTECINKWKESMISPNFSGAIFMNVTLSS
jgi:hypothetical protein